jgi:hypothetical protein
MTCDFLIYYKICVDYEDENKIRKLFEYNVENSIEERYWVIHDRNYEYETVCDYYDRVEEEKMYYVDRALERLKPINIYKNKTWICDQYKKANYQSLISKNNIKEDSVIAIWKQGDYQMV